VSLNCTSADDRHLKPANVKAGGALLLEPRLAKTAILQATPRNRYLQLPAPWPWRAVEPLPRPAPATLIDRPFIVLTETKLRENMCFFFQPWSGVESTDPKQVYSES
jgi:hypothetical protein